MISATTRPSVGLVLPISYKLTDRRLEKIEALGNFLHIPLQGFLAPGLDAVAVTMRGER